MFESHEVSKIKKRLDNLNGNPYCCEVLLSKLFWVLKLQELHADEKTVRDSLWLTPGFFMAEFEKIPIIDLHSDYRDSISALQADLNRCDWLSAKEKCHRLLLALNPFDIQALEEILEKNNKLLPLVTSSEVVLFVGNSGSGKSTAVHYLCGSSFETKSVAGLDHISPIECPNSRLKTLLESVSTSPEQCSETRYITAIPINYRDLGWSKNGGIVLCDTPGFSDIQGSEVEVANRLSLITILQKAKTVKLIVFINYKDIQEKGQGLKQLLNRLIQMVSAPNNHVDRVAYFFTKFPEEEFIQLIPKLKSIKKNLSSHELSDPSFLALLNALIEALEENNERVLRVDLLQDKPINLMRKIDKLEAFPHPAEVFRVSIGEKALNTLNNQVESYQLRFISALSQDNYILAKYYLDQLKKLNQLIQIPAVGKMYCECIIKLERHIQSHFDKTTTEFNRLIETEGDDEVTEAQFFVTTSKEFRGIVAMFSSYLSKEFIYSIDIVIYVRKLQKEFFEQIRQFGVSRLEYALLLNKMRRLVICFPDLKHIYTQQCLPIYQYVKERLDQARGAIVKLDWYVFCDAIGELNHIIDGYHNHIDSKQLKSDRDCIVEDLNNMFLPRATIIQSRIQVMSESGEFSKLEIENAAGFLEMLEISKQAGSLHAYVSLENIVKSDELVKSGLCQLYFSKKSRVELLLTQDKKQNCDEVKLLLSQLDLLPVFLLEKLKIKEDYDIFNADVNNSSGSIKNKSAALSKVESFLDSVDTSVSCDSTPAVADFSAHYADDYCTQINKLSSYFYGLVDSRFNSDVIFEMVALCDQVDSTVLRDFIRIFYLDLFDDILEALFSDQFYVAIRKNEFLKTLSFFDRYLEEPLFLNAHRKYFFEIIQALEKFQKKILRTINSGSYTILPSLLEVFPVSLLQGNQFYKKLQNEVIFTVKNKICKLSEESTATLVLFGFDIDTDSFLSLRKSFSEMSTLLSLFENAYVDFEEDRDECRRLFNMAQAKLVEHCSSLCEKINHLKKLRQYCNAYSKIKLLEKSYNCFSAFLEDRITFNMESSLKDLESCINEDISRFSTHELYQYVCDAPSNLYRDLGELSRNEAVYGQKQLQLRELIIAVFNRALLNARNENVVNKRESLWAYCRFAISVLPSDIRPILQLQYDLAVVDHVNTVEASAESNRLSSSRLSLIASFANYADFVEDSSNQGFEAAGLSAAHTPSTSVRLQTTYRQHDAESSSTNPLSISIKNSPESLTEL